MDYSLLKHLLIPEWRAYLEEIEEIRAHRCHGAYSIVALLRNGGFWTAAIHSTEAHTERFVGFDLRAERKEKDSVA